MPNRVEGELADRPCGDTHFVRFYDDDALLLNEVADFIDSALRAGGTGMVIVSRAHIGEMRRRLDALDSAAAGPRRLVVAEAEQMLARFMIEGWPDERRFRDTVGKLVAAACAGGERVHAFGEMVALLCAEGRYDAAVRLEQLWNELAAEHDFALFCAYPWRAFPNAELAAAFQQVCAEHDHVCTHRQTALPSDPAGRHLELAKLEQKALSLDSEVVRRKEAEQSLLLREREFADFLENAAEGLHHVGTDGTVLWANQAELQMLGYRRDEYVGHQAAEFHVDRRAVREMFARAAAGETVYDQPVRLRCRDGSVKHVLLNLNGCFEDSKLIHTRGCTRDATMLHERDEARRRHQEAQAELTAANVAKDEFLAMLGHELRNPLSPIVTALQLMRMRGDDATLRERTIIQRQVDHLVRLVDDLLDVSRVTRGKIDLKFERVELAQPLGKAVEMTSSLLARRGHVLDVQVEPGLDWVGDQVRLVQVVANLLTNAARYTSPGGRVLLRAEGAPDGSLRISVRDNGIGLAPDMLPLVFDLFFQGKRDMDRTEGGLGIGLTLVRKIVELHGGTVTAHSMGHGRGSEFVVTLPRRAANVEPAGRPPAEPAAAAAQHCRVMVVDDNVDAADTLGRLLQAQGHVVEVFHHPLAALAAVQRVRPQVALLDIGLPELDGYALAKRMRTLLGERRCRLIALTGYDQDADRAKSLQAGFDEHVAKPIRPEQIARLVRCQGPA